MTISTTRISVPEDVPGLGIRAGIYVYLRFGDLPHRNDFIRHGDGRVEDRRLPGSTVVYGIKTLITSGQDYSLLSPQELELARSAYEWLYIIPREVPMLSDPYRYGGEERMDLCKWDGMPILRFHTTREGRILATFFDPTRPYEHPAFTIDLVTGEDVFRYEIDTINHPVIGERELIRIKKVASDTGEVVDVVFGQIGHE